MEDLFEILPGLRKAFPDSEEIRRAVVFAVWRRAAGEGLLEQTVPLELIDKTLVILVRDNIWKRHLESMASQLVRRINALLRGSEVRFIEFRIDESLDLKLAKVNSPEETHAAPIDYEIPEDLLAKASLIPDPELREQFVKSAAVYLNRTRNKS